MKDKLKETSKRYLVVPIAVLGLIAVLAFSNVDEANASESQWSRGSFAETIAQKFNLNQDDVEEVIQELHQQRFEEREGFMREHLEERLEQAVEEGNLTETQMYAILEKFEEMHIRMDELHDQDLSPDEMHEQMADIHEEMEAWAEEQGIDFDLFMRAGRRMMKNGGRYLLNH